MKSLPRPGSGVNPSHNDIKRAYMEYVDDHEYLPEWMKGPLKEIVDTHFRAISQTIGTTELIYMRSKKRKVGK